ncbi:metal-dependent hydrolase [Clostridium botulinum]|uniref:metal-dependent hydrolase n=1 Tax=Clostridium botulinum TaxID=1491 RepID=UPI00035C2964|nr:metal-dependent hydrolase [Clostridium botulinum]MBN1035340.1 metal-dependent hydrolase [Clostridium botulinum]NFG22825.1 metal-dependent hydrolase [Clostridium botulinum]NFI51811.1 metal-dependent hydrolase [Clostridium botulinum]NFR16061.1 metal-dependent hydrolase [Clostridium botulinum]NFR45030.1 metal-dependent hydrolase [Clostridium botulinum]
MNYKTHINGGILASFYITSQMNTIELLPVTIFVGGSILGSLLPDIDHKSSYIGKKAKPVSRVINKLAGHRKLFHSPLLYLILYLIVTYPVKDALQLIFINGLFLGIVSHLILDSCTIGGLPWFYPLSKKKISLGKIKTNSQLEFTFCGIIIFINIVILLDLLRITSIFTFTQH